MTQDATPPQEVDLSPLDPDALPDDPIVLKRMLVQLVSILRSETKRREHVDGNLDQLIRKLTAPKSPAPAPGQKVLFDVGELFGPVVRTTGPIARQTVPHGNDRFKRCLTCSNTERKFRTRSTTR